MKKRRLSSKQVIARMEKNGLTFIGHIPDCTTREGEEAEGAFENQVVDKGGFINMVKIGKEEWIFSGPNPTGSKYVHRLPRSRRDAA
jgi:hypothetical protein